MKLEKQIVTDREIQGWLTLDGVSVGADDVLGDPSAGRASLQWLVERATAALCAIQVGVADRALRLTAAYGAQRQQFDRPIGSFQAFHTRAADAYVELEVLRLVTWQAAYLLAQQETASDAVSIAKFFAGDSAHNVTYAAEHLHGGIGADVDYPVHRYYLWSRQIEAHARFGRKSSCVAGGSDRELGSATGACHALRGGDPMPFPSPLDKRLAGIQQALKLAARCVDRPGDGDAPRESARCRAEERNRLLARSVEARHRRDPSASKSRPRRSTRASTLRRSGRVERAARRSASATTSERSELRASQPTGPRTYPAPISRGFSPPREFWARPANAVANRLKNHGVRIPLADAKDVFLTSSLPRFAASTRKIYPGIEQLPADAQAMLLSLVYNRGAALGGDRRKEMKAIVALVQRGDLAGIAQQLRSMKRLWDPAKLPGLIARREREAVLVERANRVYSPDELIRV